MRGRALTVVTLFATAASLLLSPPAAYAVSGELTVFGEADLVTKTQSLTESMGGFDPGQLLFATYRQVPDPDHAPDAKSACQPTMATNFDARILDAVAGEGSNRVVLPLGLFVVCSYYTDVGKTAEADARLLGTAISGEWLARPPPPAPRRTAVWMTPYRFRTTVTVVGSVGGPASGTVAIQRKVGKNYVTIARLPVRRSTFGGVVPAARGQILRTVLLPIPGKPGWAASRSADMPVR
jgi:hypothetical protein